MSHLEPGGFVGSMAFNRFIQEIPASAAIDTGLKSADSAVASSPDCVYIEGEA